MHGRGRQRARTQRRPRGLRAHPARRLCAAVCATARGAVHVHVRVVLLQQQARRVSAGVHPLPVLPASGPAVHARTDNAGPAQPPAGGAGVRSDARPRAFLGLAQKRDHRRAARLWVHRHRRGLRCRMFGAAIRVEYEVDADSGSFCFDFSSSATFGLILDELQGSAYPLQGICARVAQARDVWFCNRENLREIGKIQFEIQGSSNNQGRLGVQMGTLVGEDACMPVEDPLILPLQQQCSVDQDGIEALVEQTVPEYHAGSLMQKLNDMLLVHEDYNVSSLGVYMCTLTADGSALPCKVESVQNSAAQISYPSAYQAAAPTAAELSLCIESHGSKRCKSQAVTLTHAAPQLCKVNTPSSFAFARKVIMHKGSRNKVR